MVIFSLIVPNFDQHRVVVMVNSSLQFIQHTFIERQVYVRHHIS